MFRLDIIQPDYTFCLVPDLRLGMGGQTHPNMILEFLEQSLCTSGLVGRWGSRQKKITALLLTSILTLKVRKKCCSNFVYPHLVYISGGLRSQVTCQRHSPSGTFTGGGWQPLSHFLCISTD